MQPTGKRYGHGTNEEHMASRSSCHLLHPDQPSNAKLNGGVEVNEHFKSCYQMFPIYGNFMKAFMQLKESAKSEPKLQVNLHILVK